MTMRRYPRLNVKIVRCAGVFVVVNDRSDEHGKEFLIGQPVLERRFGEQSDRPSNGDQREKMCVTKRDPIMQKKMLLNHKNERVEIRVIEWSVSDETMKRWKKQ